jgi:hypothetical protein
MAKPKKEPLALFEVMHGAKRPEPLKIPPHARPGAANALAQRKGVWLRLTPGHMLAVLLLVVAVALAAYFAGRGEPPVAKDGPSTEQLRQGQANPDVLEPKLIPAAPGAPDMVAVPSTSGPVTAPGGARTIGYTYIVVQSYPEAASAGKVRDYMTAAGIPCTVEKGLPGYSAKWYCVVTSTGFARLSSREYDDYARQVRSVASKFPGPKFMKETDQLMAYKWR